MLHEPIFLATCLPTMTTENQRGCHTFAIFFRNLQRPRWKLFTTLSILRQLEISCEQKTGSNCLVFTKLPYRFRWTCHTQDISTFLATRNATFCCRCRLQNCVFHVKSFLQLVAQQKVARKIASCNMALTSLPFEFLTDPSLSLLQYLAACFVL